MTAREKVQKILSNPTLPRVPLERVRGGCDYHFISLIRRGFELFNLANRHWTTERYQAEVAEVVADLGAFLELLTVDGLAPGEALGLVKQYVGKLFRGWGYCYGADNDGWVPSIHDNESWWRLLYRHGFPEPVALDMKPASGMIWQARLIENCERLADEVGANVGTLRAPWYGEDLNFAVAVGEWASVPSVDSLYETRLFYELRQVPAADNPQPRSVQAVKALQGEQKRTAATLKSQVLQGVRDLMQARFGD